MKIRQAKCGFLLWIALGAAAAGSDDRYRYILEENNDDKLCRHMERVYNEHFAYPWKRPILYEDAYGPQSPYAFPKLPGVKHDDRMALDMSYSRLPTSPEFEVIGWKEGRYRLIGLGGGPDHGDQPMLVAEFDIDNDGTTETVLKNSFMLTYAPGGGGSPGGEDTLHVFGKETIDLTQAIMSEIFYRGQGGRKKPAMIGVTPGMFFRQIRPFVVDGVVYLSAYDQIWGGYDDMRNRESMLVLRYRGVSANPDPIDRRNIVRVDRICEFRMVVVK